MHPIRLHLIYDGELNKRYGEQGIRDLLLQIQRSVASDIWRNESKLTQTVYKEPDHQ